MKPPNYKPLIAAERSGIMEDRINHSAGFVLAHLYFKTLSAVAALNSVEAMVGAPLSGAPGSPKEFRSTIEKVMQDKFGGVPDDVATYVVLATDITRAIERQLGQQAGRLAAEMGMGAIVEDCGCGECGDIHVNGPRGSA